jgi:hypothetical protein
MIIASIGLLGGCFELPSESKIENFRVLGLSAEPPEIAPGEGTRMEILWADPEGDGREVTFAWMGCTGYIHSSQGIRTCDMVVPPIVRTAEEGGDVLEIPSLPEDILDYAPEGLNWIKVTFIVLMCAGGELPAEDEYVNHRNVSNVNTLCDGGEGISIYKNVTISEADDPQRNPVIDYILVDDTRLEPAPDGAPFEVGCTQKDNCGAKVALSAFFTEESLQSYEVIEFEEPTMVNERMSITWFVTGGDMKTPSAGPAEENRIGPYENTWKPEEPGTFTLFAVAHDERGGASWVSYLFEVVPK